MLEAPYKERKFAAQFVGLEAGVVICWLLLAFFLRVTGWVGCFTVQVPAIECKQGVFVCIGTCTGGLRVCTVQWISTDICILMESLWGLWGFCR